MSRNRMKSHFKTLLVLHIMLMIYSLSGIFSKLAAGEKFLSIKFCIYYGMIILLLGFYAIGWQQVIKRLPLTTAFANKAITIIWGMVWGVLFFSEPITFGKILGAIFVILGVIIFAYSEKDAEDINHE